VHYSWEGKTLKLNENKVTRKTDGSKRGAEIDK
jgi:hypothetical protein